MRTAGIDIGSRTVKVAILENRQVLEWRVAENSHDSLEVADSTLREVRYDRVVATGYGRHLFAQHRPCPVITEIRAVAAGARLLFPYCRTVLDIGGQDTKALALGIGGGVSKFEMNDRCAAGTGRSLEMMATALRYRLTEFVGEALIATKACQINSLCAVFAQSEVVSLLAKGHLAKPLLWRSIRPWPGGRFRWSTGSASGRTSSLLAAPPSIAACGEKSRSWRVSRS